MERPLRSPAIPAWELPGVRARLRATQPGAEIGADRASVAVCLFVAPPALLLSGVIHAGPWPLGFWLAACTSFFTGLLLALRLEPLPPRRVFEPSDSSHALDARGAGGHGDEIEMRPILWNAAASVLDLPGIAAGMSTPEILEQLAKLREQGDLSGNEYHRVLAHLDREHPAR